MTDQSKIAAIQMASSPNVNANLLEAARLAEDAAKSGAKLIVLPENFAFIGKRDKDLLNLKESAQGGPLQDFLSSLAKRLKIWIVGGTIPIEADDATKVYASCLVYNDKGKKVARYDKIHLFDVHLTETDEHYAESAVIEAGDKLVVIDTPFGKLGLAICYDLRFPELFRLLLNRGAEIIAIPASFTALTGKAHWETLVRARAIENLCYVIAAAQGGYHISGRETHGKSLIADPWGTVIAKVPRGSAHIVSSLDMDFLKATRRNFPCIEHRRFCTDL